MDNIESNSKNINRDNDDRDISSSSSVPEYNDLFSYNLNNDDVVDKGESSFDLNSFSSKSEKDAENERKSQKKKKTRKQGVLKVLISVFLIGVITVSLVVGAFMFYAFTMIDGTLEQDLNNLQLNLTTTIYVDDGKGDYKEYRRLHGEYNRIWVDYINPDNTELPEDYDGIPQTLAKAFIAIEDQRFSDHEGVDWKRTMGAFINEFIPIYSSRQGGSTITQQLVKNLTDDRTQKASRKVREIMRARYVESKYSKDTILECYLNTIPMGHGTYGVEVAANYYFGKSVNELTLLECASLASITKAPSNYSPDDNPNDNKKRRNLVLKEMLKQGYITQAEYDENIDAELKVVAEERVLHQNDINSYFVDALIDQVSDDLAAKYGYDETQASKLFYTGGYKIYATVDVKAQEAAEKAYKNEANIVEGENKEKLTGAITVMDYKGNVKAIVGGFGEKTGNRVGNHATEAVRQPGSSIKPLSVYSLAIEKNLIHYSSIVNDTKANYKGWSPVNVYKGYLGNITVQHALERSVNTIPVALVDKLGTQTSFDFLVQKYGIKTLDKEDVNLAPLGMGGTRGGLTTLQSAAAFAVFGNGGLYYEPTFYSKVTDQDGKIVLERKPTPKMAISEDTATVMNHLLRTVIYGDNGTGSYVKSYITNMQMFGKTGTTNDSKDLWFVGGTPYYVAACWTGFAEKQQPVPKSHNKISRRLWGEVMAEIHAGLEPKEFKDSSYATELEYCTDTGLIANGGCPSKATGWYRKTNIPKECTTHTAPEIDPNNPDGGTSSDTSSGTTSSNTQTQ